MSWGGACNRPLALAEACPNGVDVDFENVGGAVLDAVWPRIALCGLITEDNDNEPSPGPNLRNVLTRRISLQGFNIIDHRDRVPDFLRDISMWVREGRIKHREHVVEGLDNAPNALIDVLSRRNFGKVVIRLGERRSVLNVRRPRGC